MRPRLWRCSGVGFALLGACTGTGSGATGGVPSAATDTAAEDETGPTGDGAASEEGSSGSEGSTGNGSRTDAGGSGMTTAGASSATTGSAAGPGSAGDTGDDESTTAEDPTGDPVVELTGAHCGAGTPAHVAGTWLYVGGGGTEGRVGSSLDGESWVDATTVSRGTMDLGHTRNLIRGVDYGGGVFVAVGGHDNSYISVSCDGETWRQDVLGTNIDGPVPPEHSFFLSDVAYLDGVFVAAGGAGTRLRSDDHGLTWTAEGEWYDGHFRAIESGNGVFVAVGGAWAGGDAIVSTSPDGLDWTPVDVTLGGFDRGLAFHDGVFLAVGPQRCAWSTDGAAWTDCGLAAGAEFFAVHAIAGQFWVQRGDGTVVRSQSGMSWAAPINAWLPNGVVEGPDRIVGAYDGQRGHSQDGTSWTLFTMPGLARLTAGVVRVE